MQARLTVQGMAVPAFMYGTAWKEGETARLTRLALEHGFRAIDTANQRKHYFEAAVGEAVAQALADGLVTREELFLQTKFTHLVGQDDRLPYDRQADAATQVRQSMARSLEHLRVTWVDSYVLHGPTYRVGWATEDRAAWATMQELLAAGQARSLGVSNVSLEQLEELCQLAAVPPSFVQNRCFASQGWDRQVRRFCTSHGIIYQGFSLLTANSREMAHPRFTELVRRVGRTPAQVVFRFAIQVGMLPLTGTTNAAHMLSDLEAFDFELSEADLVTIESL